MSGPIHSAYENFDSVSRIFQWGLGTVRPYIAEEYF
jgi:hypothetical protein